MYERAGFDPAMVAAASGGNQKAVDELVAASLPLVYNIVGRSLDGHTDVDDVVQETMLHAVRGLPSLRDPHRFRSWLVTIAIQEVRGRWRNQDRSQPRADLDIDVTDPGADFVDLTIIKLGLQGQRREVAEATRWLDRDDRHLLSLWWLEAAGEITRAELADALGLTQPQAAVRVQRMRGQLDAARAIVRALRAPSRCEPLAQLARDWDGSPSPLWRKRFARHTRECDSCAYGWSGLVPADRLLVGLALVPLAAGFSLPALWTGAGALEHAAASNPGGWFAKLTTALTTKPAVAAAAIVVLAGGTVTAYGLGAFETTTSSASPGTTGTSTLVTPSASAEPIATASTGPSASPSPSMSKTPSLTGPFGLLAPRAKLPSGQQCATAVSAKNIAENKALNTAANKTKGHTVAGASGLFTRVDGNFTGTTEQILRWAACKWGINEDMVKAQAAIESWWHMANKGDYGTDASRCPANHGLGVDGTAGKCPESYGMMQIRYPYNQTAFPGVESSTAMNVDFAFAVWRDCFEGGMTWLNTVERGSDYAAGDAWGCMGVWFSGRWHTTAAEGYITRVKEYLDQRIWTTPNFQQP